MKVLTQWTRTNPRDWEAIDSADWPNLPKGPLPKGDDIITDEPLWLHRTNIQGVTFTGDHCAVIDITDGVRFFSWNDDPEDYPDGEKYAEVWDFLTLAPDAKFNYTYNTRQSRIIYAQADIHRRWAKNGPIENTIFRPWSEFVAPPAEITNHCIWVSKQLNEQHEQIQSIRGWREWTEGIPIEYIKNGEVSSVARVPPDG